MAYQRWRKQSTCVYNIAYHLIWCPKFRRKVLVGQVVPRLEALIKEKAKELDVEIVQMEVMPDHVHLFVKAPPTYAPQFVVRQLKAYTTPILRAEFDHLMRMASLWTRSFYCESVGHLSEEAVTNYIEEQKNN